MREEFSTEYFILVDERNWKEHDVGSCLMQACKGARSTVLCWDYYDSFVTFSVVFLDAFCGK